MKRIKSLLGLGALLCGMSFLTYANHNHSFTLQVSSDKPQAFFGAYMTDSGLTAINETTPFEVTLKSNQIVVMLSAKDPKTFITVKLLKETSSNPLKMDGKARSVVMCDSYREDRNHCNIGVQTGK